MRYESTRGGASAVSFTDVLFQGLAPDGGLYLPQTWPKADPLKLQELRGKEYAEVAARVMHPFVGDALTFDDMLQLSHQAYEGFDHKAVVPVTQLSQQAFLMELYHGPTLAFKDLAMQFIGRLFDKMLSLHARKATIIGATSGDTGAAAVEAFRGRQHADVVILYPHGRVSQVQRQQMTTAQEDNVHIIAIEGTFDDCQALVKHMFSDRSFVEDMSLSGVNSINWARVMAQAVYYVTTSMALDGLGGRLRYVVPTGNFGDIFAGYVAHAIGVPMAGLVAATNANDIIRRVFDLGEYRPNHVHETLSPAMDIQVSSNFERLMYLFMGRDAERIKGLMQALAQGGFDMPEDFHRHEHRSLFSACSAQDDDIRNVIARVYHETGLVIDPHTATGLHAHYTAPPSGDVIDVCLACAHPAKFPEAVHQSIQITPTLPEGLKSRLCAAERESILPADLDKVKQHIRSHVGVS